MLNIAAAVPAAVPLAVSAQCPFVHRIIDAHLRGQAEPTKCNDCQLYKLQDKTIDIDPENLINLYTKCDGGSLQDLSVADQNILETFGSLNRNATVGKLLNDIAAKIYQAWSFSIARYSK